MVWWQKYIEVPFEERGRSMDGADCWGLVQLIYRQELNIELPSYLETYETTNDREKLAEIISLEAPDKWVYPENPKEFDVILIKIQGVAMHVGVVTKKNHMIHCSVGKNTTHENFKTSRWKHKIAGFGRWKG